MSTMDNFKSKINFDNKSIFGLVLIFLAIIAYLSGFFDVVLKIPVLALYIDGIALLMLIAPGLVLIFPKEDIKYNKPVAIVCVVLEALFLVLVFFTLYLAFTGNVYSFSSYYSSYSSYSYSLSSSIFFLYLIYTIIEVLLALYGLFCAFLISVPSEGPAEE